MAVFPATSFPRPSSAAAAARWDLETSLLDESSLGPTLSFKPLAVHRALFRLSSCFRPSSAAAAARWDLETSPPPHGFEEGLLELGHDWHSSGVLEQVQDSPRNLTQELRHEVQSVQGRQELPRKARLAGEIEESFRWQ